MNSYIFPVHKRGDACKKIQPLFSESLWTKDSSDIFRIDYEIALSSQLH